MREQCKLVLAPLEFILKAKSVGLTLAEMKRVIEVARQGKNPRPQVVQWIDRGLLTTTAPFGLFYAAF